MEEPEISAEVNRSPVQVRRTPCSGLPGPGLQAPPPEDCVRRREIVLRTFSSSGRSVAAPAMTGGLWFPLSFSLQEAQIATLDALGIGLALVFIHPENPVTFGTGSGGIEASVWAHHDLLLCLSLTETVRPDMHSISPSMPAYLSSYNWYFYATCPRVIYLYSSYILQASILCSEALIRSEESHENYVVCAMTH